MKRSCNNAMVFALLVAVFVLGACSSDDDDSENVLASDQPDTAQGDTTDTPDTTETTGITDTPAVQEDRDEVPAAEGGETEMASPTFSDAGIDDGLPDEVAMRLERALSLYRMDPLALGAAITSRFDTQGSLVETERTVTISEANGSRITDTRNRCSNGGSVQSVDTADMNGLVRNRSLTFENCQIGAFTVNGVSVRGANPLPDDVTLPRIYTRDDLRYFYPRLDLRLVDSRNGSETTLGRNAQAYFDFPFQSPTSILLNHNRASSGDQAIVLVASDGTTTSVSGAVGIAYFDDGTGQIGSARQSNSDFDIAGDGADGLRSITSLEAFSRDSIEPPFTSGRLDIAGDGFAYRVNAGNGDPNTFQLDVEVDDATSSYIVEWSERFEVEAFRPAAVDLGGED